VPGNEIERRPQGGVRLPCGQVRGQSRCGLKTRGYSETLASITNLATAEKKGRSVTCTGGSFREGGSILVISG
jgi:hypothetical protein